MAYFEFPALKSGEVFLLFWLGEKQMERRQIAMHALSLFQVLSPALIGDGSLDLVLQSDVDSY